MLELIESTPELSKQIFSVENLEEALRRKNLKEIAAPIKLARNDNIIIYFFATTKNLSALVEDK